MKIDWTDVYQNDELVGTSRKDAKSAKKKYYRNACERHGPVLYHTVNGTCVLCNKEYRGEGHSEKIQRYQRKYSNKNSSRLNSMLARAKQRARSKGIEFDLSIEDLHTDGICPVFRTKLLHGNRTKNDNSPSLDRLDSSRGYVKGNVAIVSNRANTIKSSGSIDDHLKIAFWMMLKNHTEDEVLVYVHQLLEEWARSE